MPFRLLDVGNTLGGNSMEPMLDQPRAAGPDNRRAARVRKVRPVAFVSRRAEAEPAMRTVTANVSRGGMLLVTRQDSFPPAGSSVLLMPFEVSAQAAPDAGAAIQGRIVYTRFSPRAQLRFAGLKFEQELPVRAAQILGLDGRPDSVSDAVMTLEELESMAGPTHALRMPELPREREQQNQYIERAAEPRAMETAKGGPEGRVRAALMEARMEFIRATAVFMEAWGEARMRDTLGLRHALARAKGVDGLRDMKREWAGLRGNIAVLAEAEFEKNGVWPRVGLDPAVEKSLPYYNLEYDQPTPAIMQTLRMLAGQVGRLLVRHGFDDVGAGSDWTLVPGERGSLTFTGAMAFSDDMRTALIRAGQLHGELRRAIEQGGLMRENEARAEALRFWDRA